MSATTGATVLPPGMVIDRKYEVLGPLGQGGQATVYRVKDHSLQTEAALKLVATLTPHAVWHEASMLRSLRGQFILPVLNADLIAGAAYVVTEIAAHGTVEQKITTAGASIRDSIRWTLQAARGLTRMHDHGLLHNDLKPGNLFLDGHSNALVGDLGFATQIGPDGKADLTGGTPQVMPPEVASVLLDHLLGRPVTTVRVCTARSDVFALGACLYWLMAGHAPFQGADQTEVLRNATASSYTPIRLMAPHLPLSLARVIEKAMASNIDDRYASASEFDHALAGASLPERVWDRTGPHPGHLQCYVGTKRRSEIAVCVVQSSGAPSMMRIESRHASGRRAAPDGSTMPKKLVSDLRSTFKGLK